MKEDRWTVVGLMDHFGHGEVDLVHEECDSCRATLHVSEAIMEVLWRRRCNPPLVTLRQLRGLDPLPEPYYC